MRETKRQASPSFTVLQSWVIRRPAGHRMSSAPWSTGPDVHSVILIFSGRWHWKHIKGGDRADAVAVEVLQVHDVGGQENDGAAAPTAMNNEEQTIACGLTQTLRPVRRVIACLFVMVPLSRIRLFMLCPYCGLAKACVNQPGWAPPRSSVHRWLRRDRRADAVPRQRNVHHIAVFGSKMRATMERIGLPGRSKVSPISDRC